MREALIALMVGMPIVGTANAIWTWWIMRTFLADVQSIASDRDLERLKRVVAFNMYAALLQIMLLILPIAVLLVGMYQRYLVTSDVIYLLVPAFVMLVLGQLARRVEIEIHNMPVTREHEDDVAHILDTWTSRAFPDW